MELRLFFAMYVLLLMQIVMCNELRCLTSAQMKQRGAWPGFPLMQHAGFWGNFLLVPLLTSVVPQFHPRGLDVRLCVLLGFVVSAALHWTYTWGDSPGCHNEKGRLNAAGWDNLVFTGLAFSLIFFAYLGSDARQSQFMAMFTVIIAVYVAIGILQPPASVEGEKVKFQHWAQAVGAAALLAFAYFHLPH